MSSFLKYAPSDPIRQQAEKLLKKGRWRNLGMDSDLAWGEVRSRGASYFRPVFSPKDNRFYCNCSARQLPCAHVLALASWCDANQHPSKDERPSWVTSYIDRMQTPAEAKEQRSLSEAERKQRQVQRLQNRSKRVTVMQVGMSDLKVWLEDVIRQGIAQLESYTPDQWERIAARMVDAKLGSVARRFRTMPERIGHPNWPEEILEEIGQLFLLAEGFQRLEALPDELQDEMLSQAGVNFKKEEILQEQPVLDHWAVLGIETGTTENLQFRRTWLQSTQFSRSALLLDFVWGDQPFEQHWRVGQQMEAEVVYYPGPFQQRALLKSFKQKVVTSWAMSAYGSLEEFANDYADALGQNPWILQLPAVLEEVIPIQTDEDQWGLLDVDQRYLPLSGPANRSWALLAQSGGNPIDVFGVFNGKGFEVLSIRVATTKFLPLS